jgi:hypothetical protein
VKFQGLRRSVIAVELIALAIILAACGKPSQQYATDKPDGVYFTVPLGWTQIPTLAINSVEAKSTSAGAADRLAAVHWQVAYTLDKSLKADQVLSLKTPPKPVVYVRVRSLLPDEINAVSYNTLRNLVVPITSWASGNDPTAPALSIADDAEVVEKGGRGIQTQYTFKASDGLDQTIIQAALMSNDHSTMYIMIVRCSSTCFTAHSKEIAKIVKSFTVRGPK